MTSFYDNLKRLVVSKYKAQTEKKIINTIISPDPIAEGGEYDDETGTFTGADGVPVEATISGNPAQTNKKRWDVGVKITPDKYVVINQHTPCLSTGGKPTGMLLLATWATYPGVSKLFIRRLDSEDEYEVPLPEGYDPTKGMWADIFICWGWHQSPWEGLVQPLFSPSGKHLFIPIDSQESDERGSVRYRIIKNFSLVHDIITDKFTVEGEIIDKYFVFDWEFMSSLPCVEAAAPPDINLTSVTTQYSAETDATTYYEPATDPLLNTIWGTDVKIFSFGWVAPICEIFPPVWNMEVNEHSEDGCWFYTFTEDVNGDPVVNFFCEYISERISCKSFQAIGYSSSDKNYSGFYPFVNGFPRYGGVPEDKTKVKLNQAGNYMGPNYDWVDAVGQTVHQCGWGDTTPPTGYPFGENPVPPVPPAQEYIRHMLDRDIREVYFENYVGAQDQITNKVNMFFHPDYGGDLWKLSGGVCLKVRHALKQTYPPEPKPEEEDYPVALSYFWFKNKDGQRYAQDWTGRERLYIWLKNVDLQTPGKNFATFLRINPDSFSPIDVPFLAEFKGTEEYKLIEIDLAGFSITAVNSLTLVYFVPGWEGNIEEAPDLFCWFDATGMLVNQMYNPPDYSSPCWYFHSDIEKPEVIYPSYYPPTIYKDITYGTAKFSLGITTYREHLEGTQYGYAGWNFAGFLAGISYESSYADQYFSNSAGIPWSPYVTFINSKSRRGLLQILNLNGSPEINTKLFDDDTSNWTGLSSIKTDPGNLSGLATEPAPSSIQWEFHNGLMGVWGSKENKAMATTIMKWPFGQYNDGDNYYYSPWTTDNPINYGLYDYWFEPRSWTGPHYSDKIWAPDVSVLNPEEGGQRLLTFLRFKDSYIMMYADLDNSDPENIKGQIRKLDWDEETQKMVITKTAQGKPFAASRVVDWHIF